MPHSEPAALSFAAMIAQAFTVDSAVLSLEGGTDPAFGTVQWRTLISGDRTPSTGLVLGVAEFGAYGTLLPHRHAPEEFYFCLSGDGVVTIEGTPHPITPGVAIYIPAEAEHGVVAGTEGLTFVYGFARNSFGEVDYRFSAPANIDAPIDEASAITL
ncbi:MAG: cupin domain-containing protein [Rhodobacteraceae bacterium]|nr:cupin domain-containing protein [Paracoccaceae bacterium]